MIKWLSQIRMRSLAIGIALCMILGSGVIGAQEACVPTSDLATDQLSRCQYADQLRAMWLGETIANWTGLTTEGVRIDAPFYTDADWGIDQDISWKRDDTIEFIFQDPWLADDDTDIEYVYFHLLSKHDTISLTAEQIAEGWRNHMNDFIWVSNAQARNLMEFGVLPPVTSMGAVNDDYLQIDAQLTTEVFGALAPGMPGQALSLADLPIRTTAGGYSAHAAQFHVVLYALVPLVDPTLSPAEQNIWLVRESRRYIPDTSKSADVIDFVLEDYLANPDKDNWELTRDRVYERYHSDARENGFVYRNWTESSVNLAAGLLAFLYGEGDFRRTVQIGTLSGWDSDNGTATFGGLLGLMMGYEELIAQFPDIEISDRYHIHRTRPTMPDFLPDDHAAEDTFSMLAERMLPFAEQAIVESGGIVDGDVWTLPSYSIQEPLQLNPLESLSQRSANYRILSAGGTVEVDISGEAVQSRVGVIADGAEHDFSGEERRRLPRLYQRFVSDVNEPVTLTVIYDETVEVSIIRLVEGYNNAFSDIEAYLLISEEWQSVPEDITMSVLPDASIPHQMIDVNLSEPVFARGVQVIAAIDAEIRGPMVSILELDVLSP